jgi:predicted nuclease with TOPRIM domain
MLESLAANQIEEREARVDFREDLEILYQTIRQAGEAAEADREEARADREQAKADKEEFRAAILGLQTENRQLQEQADARWNATLEEMRRIWMYLYDQLRYRSNGDSNTGTGN